MRRFQNALPARALKAAYSAGQAARILWHTGHYAAGRRIMGPLTEPGFVPDTEESGPLDRRRLRAAFFEIFQKDWENIEAGRYRMPLELQRPPLPSTIWRQSRDYLRDTAKVARRKALRGHAEVRTETTKGRYPQYFLQNFHYQSDGWLSRASAARYDMQVETLFTGAAGAMRRAGLPAIGAGLAGKDAARSRLLDLGCGAGTLLAEVKHNWPDLQVTALDLSPAYLGRARTRLGRWKHIEYVQEKAEATGLSDASYDFISCVYLFHELPPAIRRDVVREAARLLKPGGLFILVDTLQYGDEPGLDPLLRGFPRGFHEPYYDSYCRLALDNIFGSEGLVFQNETLAFLSKVSLFQKPN
ncbi:MAG: class I SAM-dependent methyltransferase [Pseudomonadota bacterium]